MRQQPGRGGPSTDRGELARLYDEYAAGLFRYALIVLADYALAEDVVQQVFAKLVARAGRLEAPERYLRRAVRNECYSLLERRRAEQPRVHDTARILEPVADKEIDEADRLALEAALRSLPAEQREVVVLKVYEGWTLQEIAEETGVPLNTAASRYRYAMNKLRAALSMPMRSQS
jgi:RNA polymerase sigma-70 factor (ECF subfamily)